MHSFKDLPGLDPLGWQAMLQLGQTRAFEPGQIIFAEGAPSAHIYVVRRGLVEIMKESVSGKMLRLAILDEGTVFGEGALFAASPRSTTAVAFRDTVVGVIASDLLRGLLETRPDFARLLYRALSARLHQVVVDLDADLRLLHQRLHHQHPPEEERT